MRPAAAWNRSPPGLVASHWDDFGAKIKPSAPLAGRFGAPERLQGGRLHSIWKQ
jgi:hypothetical protein